MVEFLEALGWIGRVLWFDMRGLGMSDPVPGGSSGRGLGRRRGRRDGRGGVRPGDDDCAGPRVPTALPERISGLVLFNGFTHLARDDDYSAGMRRESTTSCSGRSRRRGDRRVRPSSAVDSPAIGRRRPVGEDGEYAGTPRMAVSKSRTIYELDLRERAPAGGLADPRRARAATTRTSASTTAGISRSTSMALDSWSSTVLSTGCRPTWAPRRGRGVRHRVLPRRRRCRARAGDRARRRRRRLDGARERARRPALEYARSALRGRRAAGAQLVGQHACRCRRRRRPRHVRRACPCDPLRGTSGTRCTCKGSEVRSASTPARSRDAMADAGIAVHIAARVEALAAPGEVLVTRTVRDLVAGSGIAFDERGEHELKGVPDGSGALRGRRLTPYASRHVAAAAHRARLGRGCLSPRRDQARCGTRELEPSPRRGRALGNRPRGCATDVLRRLGGRTSRRPRPPVGVHGKAQNLAALAEAGFLILVSIGIAVAAILRLAGVVEFEVEPTWWTFAAIALVLVIDGSRTMVCSWCAALRERRAPRQRAPLRQRLRRNDRRRRRADRGRARLPGRRLDRCPLRVVPRRRGRVPAREPQRRRAWRTARPRRTRDRASGDRGARASGRASGASGSGEPAGSTSPTSSSALPGGRDRAGHAAADRVEQALHQALPGIDVVVHVEPRGGEAVRARARRGAHRLARARDPQLRRCSTSPAAPRWRCI